MYDDFFSIYGSNNFKTMVITFSRSTKVAIMKITMIKGTPSLTPPIALVFQKVKITPTKPSWLTLIEILT
jgi:hypothetical protein